MCLYFLSVILLSYFLQKQSANERLKLQLSRTQDQVKKIFNGDQLCALSRQGTQGMKWSDETVKSALQLRFACGSTGYQTILDQNLPYPSQRTLQRRLENISFCSGILDDVFSLMKTKV